MTIQEFAAEVNPERPPEAPRSRWFTQALELIRTHRVLHLLQPEVREAGLGLEIMIPALLAFSAENHFIKFNPWDPTIVVKLFPPSLVVYQYNPFRDIRNRQAEGQKPAAAPGQKTDFLAWETFPDAEHYLIWTATSGRRYAVLAQVAPIVPGHLIIASLDYNPAGGRHFTQAMTPEHLADMHELGLKLDKLGYAMGFNDTHAGASVDHFHTQAVFRNFLPLVRAWSSGQIAVKRTLTNPQGVRLYLLDSSQAEPIAPGRFPYPVRGILLESKDAKALLSGKSAVLAEILQQGRTFNSIGWTRPEGVFVEAFFPRRQEAIMQNALKAGYVEMSGMIVIPNQDFFNGITGPEPGEAGLGEAGLDAETFREFTDRILPDFE